MTVSIATGRIPGPWVQTVRDAIPNGALGPCVYGNGCIVVDANNNPLWEAQLPSDVVRRVLEFTRGGVAGPGGARLSVLAATRWEGELRYCELAPGGAPSEVAALIDRAGEPPAVRFETLDGFEARDVVKFVMWTQQDDGWAHMPSTVEALRGVLDGTDATILDHGEKFCEVLPPGVNKGAGVARLCEALGVAPAEILAAAMPKTTSRCCRWPASVPQWATRSPRRSRRPTSWLPRTPTTAWPTRLSDSCSAENS